MISKSGKGKRGEPSGRFKNLWTFSTLPLSLKLSFPGAAELLLKCVCVCGGGGGGRGGGGAE